MTIDWWRACQDATVPNPGATFAAYADHVSSIRDRLTGVPSILLDGAGVLHDARLLGLRASNKIVLVLRVATADGEAVDAELVYTGAPALKTLDLSCEGQLPIDSTADLGYHEFDALEDGRILHSLLFWPGTEIQISARVVELRIAGEGH